jgi:hypothetical protein
MSWISKPYFAYVMPCERHVRPDLHRRNGGGQVAHPHQIVGGTGQGKYPVHFAHPAMPDLSHQRDGLQPAKTFFDPLPLLLAEGVTRVPRGAAINRATSASPQVLCHVRCHAQVSEFCVRCRKSVPRAYKRQPANGRIPAPS